MTGSRGPPSSGSSGTTPKPRRRVGRARAGRPRPGTGWIRPARRGEQTANRALDQAGREERVDGRSLADRRDAAHREGDLERAAALSREPNVHLGPERYRKRGGTSATIAQAERVKQRTATAQAERDADRQQVARVEREIAGIGARAEGHL